MCNCANYVKGECRLTGEPCGYDGDDEEMENCEEHED